MKGLRILMAMVLGFSTVLVAHAHRFAPSLLQVDEIAPQQYNMVWKTPAQGVSNVPLRPQWPQSCKVQSASEPQLCSELDWTVFGVGLGLRLKPTSSLLTKCSPPTPRRRRPAPRCRCSPRR